MSGQDYYRYDGHGRRALSWRPVGGSTLSLYSQGGQVMYQEAMPHTRASEHIYLAGSLVASRERDWTTNAMATKYQHTDALGSPIAVSNEAGTIIDRTNYDPYGGPINKVIDGIGYTGHVMDPTTGLTNMQQRYYDQGVGRFLSVDPVSASSINGGNFNRYWYANNNPYKFVDPDGRLACTGSVPKPECIRPANPWRGGPPDVGLSRDTSGTSNERSSSNRSPTLAEKVARNLKRTADSVTIGAWGGARAGVKLRIGVAKFAVQGGAVKWTVLGASGAGDVYSQTENEGYAFGVELAGVGLYSEGRSARSVIGRDGGAWYREDFSPQRTVLGYKALEADPKSGTIGISIGLGLGVDVEMDVGKAAIGIFYWGDSELDP